MPTPREQYPLCPAQKAVCIVDNDESVADSLKILLKAFGFAVQSYHSGNEFLANKRQHAAGCLVIDQHIPGMNGLDVIDTLQKEAPYKPIGQPWCMMSFPRVSASVKLPTLTVERALPKTSKTAGSSFLSWITPPPIRNDRPSNERWLAAYRHPISRR